MRRSETASLEQLECDAVRVGKSAADVWGIVASEAGRGDYSAELPPRSWKLEWRRQGPPDRPQPEYGVWAPVEGCPFETFPLAFRHSFD